MRDVDLVSYLPPFMADYKEIRETLKAEDPEFRLIWDASQSVLYNEFIMTADEYGISRYEKMLDLYPAKEDTLESRRAKVLIRWTASLPYTDRMFLEKLIAICGENNFVLTKQYDRYRIEVEVSLDLFGQLEELEKVVGIMIPCNMVIVIKNKLSYEVRNTAYTAGGISFAEAFYIAGDSIEYVNPQAENFIGSGSAVAECVKISSEK
jgi:hypothetical protein